MRIDRFRVAAAAVVAVLLAAAAGCSSTPRPLHGGLPDTPVLLVHGYNSQSCPGADVAHTIWGAATGALTDGGWAGPVLPVSYYACDRDGVDITGYGPTPPAGAAATISTGTPRVHYDQNASIDQLAHDLGWFVYHSFDRGRTAVDLVASSMGGLIVWDLLHRVAQHDPRFPPELAVAHAVTFSTPYLGFGGTGAASICRVETVECREFAVGSTLLTELGADPQPPQGTGGTSWAAAGSSAGCDFVPAASSVGLAGTQRIDYLVPCYGHIGYLVDTDPAANATARIISPDGSVTTSKTAPHSLAWLLQALTAAS